MSSSRVAVVGATGAVGRELLTVLEQRRFPTSSVKLLASRASAGQALTFCGEQHPVETLGERSLRGVDLAFFAAGAATATAHAKAAVDAGCVVVDHSSAFRHEPDVPLVVPEVNREALRGHRGLIANPNCSAVLLTLALSPLAAAAGIRSVVVTTYQAASGVGRQGVEELFCGARAALDGCAVPPPRAFPQPLAFNALPHVGALGPGGWSGEEDKLLFEARRILGLPDLLIDATCVRVPVVRCHSEAVSVQLERPLTVTAARAAFAGAPGLVVVDEPAASRYPTPLSHAGADLCAVGRVREARALRPGLSFWLVGDQLRKGAALNAVQIAESL